MELELINNDTFDNQIKFVSNRIYDHNKVLSIPYINQILNEKYEFDYDYNIISDYILPTINTPENDNQQIYNYIINNLLVTYRVSRWIYDYNLGHEIEKYEYGSNDEKQIRIYKETPQMVFLRTQKKIQTGILGIIDEKNKQYVSETEWVKELRQLYNSEEGKLEINKLIQNIQEKFFFDMSNLNFLPSSPFLFNQGRYALKNRLEDTFIPYFKPIKYMTMEDWELIYSITDQQFGSCYSMGSIEDDIKSIYDQSFNQAEIFRNQGGYGVNFSKLRSNYQTVNSIGSKSSGQVSFMEMFNLNTKLIQLHSNTKRGASMFLLDVHHPEIMNFINSKTDFDKGYNNLKYANISVVVNNQFMKQVYDDKNWITSDPSLLTTNQNVFPSDLVFTHKQRDIWNNQILNATLHAEPGIINEDSINEDNPLFPLETITSVNPCQEYLGQDKSVCNLGSINLYQHIDENTNINYDILRQTINSLYLFLTLSNFQNDFPLEELTHNTRRYRNIGMGIMGVQSTFILKDIPYGSKESLFLLKEVMKEFNNTQLTNSVYMQSLIGSYDNFDKAVEKLNPDNQPVYYYQLNSTNRDSGIPLKGDQGIQNARLLAIQPNGSIGFISNISCGTDTIFSLAYERTVNSGFQSEYKKIQYDQSIHDLLVHKYKLDEDQQQKEMEKLGKGEMPEIFKDSKSLSTTSTVGVVEKLQILSMSNRYLDMNTSTTFNIMHDTNLDPENLKNFTQYNDEILDKQYNEYSNIRFESKQMDILKTNIQAFKQQTNYIQVNFTTSQEKSTIYDLMDKQETDIQQAYKKLKDTDGFKKLSKIVQSVNDFYLLSQILKIKGVTVYVEGSRPPVLKQIKKEEKIDKKTIGDKTEFNFEGLSLILDTKSNKLAPKDVPPYIHRIMKPLKFTTDPNNGNKEYRINVEVGFLDDTQEPFEVFFRQTNSIKNLYIDPVEYLDACARLLSWGMRSGADPEYGLVQLGKQKTFNNNYSFISGLLRDEVRDILQYNNSRGKKKKELKDIQEERKKWVLTPKGYYVDMDGKHRCPQCGNEIIHHNGCISCNQCSWSQCLDT